MGSRVRVELCTRGKRLCGVSKEKKKGSLYSLLYDDLRLKKEGRSVAWRTWFGIIRVLRAPLKEPIDSTGTPIFSTPDIMRAREGAYQRISMPSA